MSSFAYLIMCSKVEMTYSASYHTLRNRQDFAKESEKMDCKMMEVKDDGSLELWCHGRFACDSNKDENNWESF